MGRWVTGFNMTDYIFKSEDKPNKIFKEFLKRHTCLAAYIPLSKNNRRLTVRQTWAWFISRRTYGAYLVGIFKSSTHRISCLCIPEDVGKLWYGIGMRNSSLCSQARSLRVVRKGNRNLKYFTNKLVFSCMRHRDMQMELHFFLLVECEGG